MNFIFSVEFITLILSIAVIMVFKLHKRLICLILSTTKIFLPPNQKDFEIIKDLKKQKDNKASGIMRTCSVMEYLEGIKDDNTMDIDLIVFFYCACFMNLLCVEVYKFIIGFTTYNERLTQGVSDDTVTSSFAFITIIYVLFNLYKQTFSKGYWTYNAKVFYSLFLVFNLGISLVYYLGYDKYIVTINYEKICDFLNNRYEKVLTEAGTDKDHVLCTNPSLKAFYTIILSSIMAYLFRPCCRVSYFDNIIISEEQTFEEKSNLRSMTLLSKAKVIITAFLFFLFVNNLFKNQIFGNSFEYEFKLFVIPGVLICEFFVNFF
jgi:hypothetical protein